MFLKNICFELLLIGLFLAALTTSCSDPSAKRDIDIINKNIARIQAENDPPEMVYEAPVYDHTNKYVTAELLHKGKEQTDNSTFSKYIPCKLKLQNITDKDIERLSAKIYYKNTGGMLVGYTSINIDGLIQAHRSIEIESKMPVSSESTPETFMGTPLKEIQTDVNTFSFKHKGEQVTETRFWAAE